MRSEKLKINGMTCVNCEGRIAKKLQNTKGIINAKVSYLSGTAEIDYDENLISIEKIAAAIRQLGYTPTKEGLIPSRAANNRAVKILGVAVVILALYLLFDRFGLLNLFKYFPQAREGAGYGVLFVIGLLTSLHCVGMCGGINLSQCVTKTDRSCTGKPASIRPSFLYNLGRVLSYTTVGAVVGAVGSVVSFSGVMKGIVQLIAGVFMIIMGLNMLNLFPRLRKIIPILPKIFSSKIQKSTFGKGPLFVGLLNGLMPCGPLQAMQLYALSTGSAAKGAISMLLFGLGTMPLMFGLGALIAFLSQKYTRKMMAASAVLVVVLGISMFSSGMNLSGISIKTFMSSSQSHNVTKVSDNIQTVTTKLSPGSYQPITVKKDIPVKWTIKANERDINGCNNEIYIPKFNITKRLSAGDNVIEFIPTESGTFVYSCWMGMIKSQITVVENIAD